MDLLHHEPFDTFSAWWSGEGPVVVPEVLSVDALKEGLDIDGTDIVLLFVSVLEAKLSDEFVLIITDVEEHSDDCESVNIFWVSVDEVDLKVMMFSILSVL